MTGASADPALAAFAERLFAALPDLRARGRFESPVPEPATGGDASRGTAFLRIAAPSGRPDVELQLWMDDGVDPSVSVGPWFHTHATCFESTTSLDPDAQPDGTPFLLGWIEDFVRERIVLAGGIDREARFRLVGTEPGIELDGRRAYLRYGTTIRIAASPPGRVGAEDADPGRVDPRAELLDALTSALAPDVLRIRSWNGRFDADLTCDTVDAYCTGHGWAATDGPDPGGTASSSR